MGKTETAQKRAFTVRGVIMKRVIGVTDDGSDFVVTDTRSMRYALYIAGCAVYKAYSILRKARAHGQKRKV